MILEPSLVDIGHLLQKLLVQYTQIYTRKFIYRDPTSLYE